MKKPDKIFCIFPKNCRGTHVGIMLSFAIFVIFLAFLYSMVSPPITTQRDKSFFLDYLEEMLLEQSYGDIETFTLIIEDEMNPGKDCINMPNVLKEIVDEENLIIKDEEGNILSYSPQGQSLWIEVGHNFSGFIKVYYAEELNPSPLFEGGGCHPITEVLIGVIRKDTEVFELKMFDLFERYENEYDALKQEFNIPESSEFGFSFIFSNGTAISTQEEKPPASIYVKEVPIQYIDNQGNIDFGYINIRVW